MRHTAHKDARSIPGSQPHVPDVEPAFVAPRADEDGRKTVRQAAQPVTIQIPATPFVWRDPSTLPRRSWLYGRHYIRRYVSATIAPSGVGKTTLTIVEALAMASGCDLVGDLPAGRLKVWLWNGEDPREEIERRIAATAIHHRLTASDLEGYLFFDSGRQNEIVIAQMLQGGASVIVPVVDAVTQTILENGIDVVIIDPFVSSHRVTENDNNAINLVVKAWAGIADRTNTSVKLVHHSRKTASGIINVEDARGASALIAAVRSARVLNPMTKEEADRAGVDNYRRFFRVDDGKSNLAPSAEVHEWYELRSVQLGNGGQDSDSGDNVGVVSRWMWPNPIDRVLLIEDLARVQQKISTGEWRASNQANSWAGNAIAEVLSLNIRERATRDAIRGLLKTWISSGVLKEEERKDKNRKLRKYVVVGRPVE